jgi:hypothetical protein
MPIRCSSCHRRQRRLAAARPSFAAVNESAPGPLFDHARAADIGIGVVGIGVVGIRVLAGGALSGSNQPRIVRISSSSVVG